MTGYYESGIRMAKRWYDRYGWVQWLDDEGQPHREDGPAWIRSDGTQYWFNHGRYHFAHGPADLYADGRLRWYEDHCRLRRRKPYG